MDCDIMIFSCRQMKQEEEDNAFLSSLGVTSADPDDIERDILQQVLIRSI